MTPQDPNSDARPPDDIRRQVAEGLLYVHHRLTAGIAKGLETMAFLYALIELLAEKGLVSIGELDERKQVVGERLFKRFREAGAAGVLLQDPQYDKYAFRGGVEIDCENRVHLCKVACCRLPFALSRQDTCGRA